MPMVDIKIDILYCGKHQEHAKYANLAASGYDLVCDDDIVIEPGQTLLYKTKFSIRAYNYLLPSKKFNDAVDITVRPRSGLSSKGVFVILGTVDVDYQGYIGVILYNSTSEPFKIQDGSRIAQLVITTGVIRFSNANSGDFERGERGFGSSGT